MTTATVGRAEGHAVAGAPLAAPDVQALRREISSRVTGDKMPERTWVEARRERAATNVRPVGGEATLRARGFSGVIVGCDESSA